MTGVRHWIVGATHTDLAWKWSWAEMSDLLEISTLRLLDLLEHHPTFTYVIEQVAHYRALAARRPDLIERLRRFIQEGRVELAGGMASSMETNLPSGECFVRNLFLGLKWAAEHLGAKVRTGWLIDTFGINAQVPQVLRGFGIERLMANRFGSILNRDHFVARGLDGSTIRVIGPDGNSPYMRSEHVAIEFAQRWDALDRFVERCRRIPGEGPILIVPYTENESAPSNRAASHFDPAQEGKPSGWRYGTLSDFFDALEKAGVDWPAVDGDLNPEFTGTFSNRIDIRLTNRRAETALLEAEKWGALAGGPDVRARLEESWWTLAYAHFHDVFTGSMQSDGFRDVVSRLEGVIQEGTRARDDAFCRLTECVPSGPARADKPKSTGGHATPDRATAWVFNGLPWQRRDLVTLTVDPGGIRGVSASGRPLPFELTESGIRALADVPACGIMAVDLERASQAGHTPRSSPARSESLQSAIIENEHLSFECDVRTGIRRLTLHETDRAALEGAGDFLVVQQDKGGFQIESPLGAEIPCSAGSIEVRTSTGTPTGDRMVLSGRFPPIPWCAPSGSLAWEAVFSLLPQRPVLYLRLTVRWTGENSRVRLKLATDIDSSVGIHEVPFGVTRRKPYRDRWTARGEWPVQRFAAVEDGRRGLALVNTGAGGVETSGGTIWTTLLRSPSADPIGLVPDDTSSQHGEHVFDFAIVPYAGSWVGAGVGRIAQELNNPLAATVAERRPAALRSPTSYLSIDPAAVVLSSLTTADDGSGEIVLRFYEGTGAASTARIVMPLAAAAWTSDLRERRIAPVECPNGVMEIPLEAFEIKTLRIRRKEGGGSTS